MAVMDIGENDPAFWLELSPDMVPWVLDRYPEMRHWRSPKGLNFPEHLLLWPGPFPGKYGVVEALLESHPEWEIREEVLDETVRTLAIAQEGPQVDPLSGEEVYEPGEGRPVDPNETKTIATRFAVSLRASKPEEQSRRLQRMGRVLHLKIKTGGPFHRHVRDALKTTKTLTIARAYAAEHRPRPNVPQAPSPVRRAAPKAKYEATYLSGKPMAAARQVHQLHMSQEAIGKMLAALIRRRLGSARYFRRKGGLKTRWQARGARKMEYVDFRKFLQALAITAPAGWLNQPVMLPSLQNMMEDAMLEDDLDLFRSLYPNQKPANTSVRLTRRAHKIARQFSPLDPDLVAKLAREPLPYASRYMGPARNALRAHWRWDEPRPAPSVHPEADPERVRLEQARNEARVRQEQEREQARQLEARRLEEEHQRRWRKNRQAPHLRGPRPG